MKAKNEFIRSTIKTLSIAIGFVVGPGVDAGDKLDAAMPIRGFCIGAPTPKSLDAFVAFVQDELAPRRVNTLILRVDYRYQYESHPELKDNEALSREAAKKLVNVCRKNNIRIIPHINLLGHQSWAATTG